MLKPCLLTLTLGVFFISCSKDYTPLVSSEDAYLDSLLENLDPNAESIFMLNASKDPRVNNRMWQGIPSIGATKDSKQIYVAWYSGGINEGAGNYITVALSLTSGQTWMNDKMVVYPADSGFLRFFDPTIWRDKNNSIWLTWTKSHGFWDGKGGVWTSNISWNGKMIQHKDVKVLADGVMMNKPVHLSRQNSMLFPISHWSLPPSPFNKQGIFIYKGDYNNGTIKMDSLQLYSRIYVNDAIRTYDEHQIVEMNKMGKLMCMVRTKDGIYYTISEDYGKKWNALQSFKGVGATTSSRFYLGRLKSGKLLLVLNNSSQRTALKAFLSSDGGVTWPNSLLIDDRNDVSYPDAIETDDGYIHVVYDRERTKSKEILYCKFKESDIMASSSSRDRATTKIFRKKVNTH